MEKEYIFNEYDMCINKDEIFLYNWHKSGHKNFNSVIYVACYNYKWGCGIHIITNSWGVLSGVKKYDCTFDTRIAAVNDCLLSLKKKVELELSEASEFEKAETVRHCKNLLKAIHNAFLGNSQLTLF